MKELKVLQVINSLGPGGAEKLVVDTIKIYRERNLHVDIFLLDNKEYPLRKILEETPGVKILSSKTKLSVYNPLQIYYLNKYLKNYDIVHVHLFPSLYWVYFASLFSFKKVKLIFTEHNTTNRRRDHAILNFFDKLAYKKYSKIVTISNAVHENLKQYLGKKYNLFKIYNGIDLEEIHLAKPYSKKKFDLTENDVMLIQVSSFTPQKDQETLIKALALLDGKFHLFLVGVGTTMEKCQQLARELKVDKRLHFLGMRRDVPSLLKTADIVLLISHFEGLSLSSVEGLASGKPFIASDVPGLTEVVENGGILVPHQNAKQLKNKIFQITEDKALLQKTVESSLRKSKNYDVHLMVENYLNLYNSIIEDKKTKITN